MKYYVEGSLEDFTAWSGAVETLNKLIELNKVDEVESYMIECMTDASATDINDFLRFETDFIFRELLELTEEEMEELY